MSENNEFPAHPGLEGISGGFDPRELHCYLASIAVSLKRIADAMDDVSSGTATIRTEARP